ncbi:MAG: hypothetical protein WC319_12495 [Candidatus Paceibacterota bacterium]|jgi:hypothetical protein
MKQVIKDVFTTSGATYTCVVIPEGDKGSEKLRAAGSKLAGEGYCKFEENAYKNKKGEQKIRFTYRWSERGKRQMSIAIKNGKL